MARSPNVIERWFPALLALGVSGLILSRFLPAADGTLRQGAVAVLLAFGAGLGVIALVRLARPREAEAFASSPTSAAPEVDDLIRHRLAPVVVAIGSAAIIVLALVVIFTLANLDDSTIKAKLDTILVGVFSAVLPVFATWVGTILAFYYSSENLRQATQSARELTQGARPEAESVTDLKRMIPYERITKYILGEGQNASDPREVKIADLESLMKGDLVSRVVVFGQARKPVAIIRKKSLEGYRSQTPALPADAKLGEFLIDVTRATDAKRYRFVPASATVAFARQVLSTHNVADIFVTDGGQEDEPVKGWITDERLLA